MKKLIQILPNKLNLSLALFLILFIALLGGYAIQGIYSRYLQDDYCYGAEVKSQGFFYAQVDSYFNPMPYNSNRYSLTLFSGISESLGGPYSVPFLPVLAMISWAGAIYFVLFQWQKTRQKPIPTFLLILVSLVLLFFTLYLSRALYQVLLWRSAMLPYLVPAVINTYLAGRTIQLSRREKSSKKYWIELFLVGFLSAGFSETAAIWQFTLWGLALIFSFVNRNKSLAARRVIPLILVILAATLVGMICLIVSPVNFDTNRSVNISSPDLVTAILTSLRFGWDFIYDSIKSLVLPFAVVFLFGFWTGWLAKPEQSHPVRYFLTRMVVVAAICYVISFVSMIPTLLAMASYSGDRALFPAHFILVTGVFSMGWMTSGLFSSLKPTWTTSRSFSALILMLSLGLFVYTARIAPRIYDDISPLRARAAAWDQRQAGILQAKAQGQMHVNVPAFDSIALVLELRPDEGFWVNVCAAKYYGVAGITAIENYNGVKPIFK